MDKSKVTWRTWILQRGGVYPISPLYWLWQETLIQEKEDVPMCPPYTKDCPFPALTAEGPACWWGMMLTVRFSLSRHWDTRGRGSSLERTPYVRDFICQCALPNASPKQQHSREVCIKIKKAASLDSCAAPAIWVMGGCRKLSPFSLLRNTDVQEMQGPLWSRIKKYKEIYESHRHTRQSGPSYSNSCLHQTLHHCNYSFQMLLFHRSLYMTWSMCRIKHKHWLVPLHASDIVL